MYPRISDLLLDLFGVRSPLPIYSFGAMVAAAILSAAWLLNRELNRKHADGLLPAVAVKGKDAKGRAVTERVPPGVITGTLAVIAALAGIAGSKVFHLLENLDSFALDPAGMLFSTSGLTFYGGLIVAGFSIAYYVRRKGLPAAGVADAVAPGLILGYGIGRIGCYLSGDGDWGVCSRLADKPGFLPARLWSETFPRNILGENVLAGCGAGFNGVYPTMIYETAMCVAAFALLWALRKHPYRMGWLFGIYLILTGVERFLIELIRVNNVGTYLGIPATQAQVISVVLAIAGAVIVALTMRRAPLAPVTPAAPGRPAPVPA